MVCYDIRDPKRLRYVYKIMKGFGTAMQYSVFRCNLSPRKLQTLFSRIEDVIDKEEDRVMVVDLGPSDGTWVNRFTFMGVTLPIVEEQVYIF
jgi:CRISPR-associated protein Cas2